MADVPVDLTRNAFDRPIPPLAHCVNSADLRRLVSTQLLRILPPLPDHRTEQIIQDLFDVVAREADDVLAARSAHRVLEFDGVLTHLRHGLGERSEIIAHQIEHHLYGIRNVLDYGCGDGTVGLRLKNSFGLMVSLCDVMEYLDPAVRDADLPFMQLPPRDGEFFGDHMFDAVLLLTVLHHCQDPVHTLQQVRQLHPRRVITIESVYSVTADELLGFAAGPGSESADAKVWLGLSENDQFRYAYFWDWFYNKVVHDGVVVPCNFLWPDAWSDRFSTIGYREQHRKYLGIDQPLVPEFHVLQVFTLV